MASVTYFGCPPPATSVPFLRHIKPPFRKLYLPQLPLGFTPSLPSLSSTDRYLKATLGRFVGMLTSNQEPSHEMDIGKFNKFVVMVIPPFGRSTFKMLPSAKPAFGSKSTSSFQTSPGSNERWLARL